VNFSFRQNERNAERVALYGCARGVCARLNEAQGAAESALGRFKQTGVASGTDDNALRSLVGDMWAQNLDRYEPDELGGTPRSLGLQFAENLRELAIRQPHPGSRGADGHRSALPAR
jgi:hypothetical protein